MASRARRIRIVDDGLVDEGVDGTDVAHVGGDAPGVAEGAQLRLGLGTEVGVAAGTTTLAPAALWR